MVADTRAQALLFGGPIVVPAAEFDDDWQIKGVDGSDGEPCGVLVIGGAARGHLSIRTTTRHMEDEEEDEALDVRNVLVAGLPWSGIELPLTVTVTRREVELPIDGELVGFRLYESGTSWNMRARLSDRAVEVAGGDGFQADISLVSITDLDELPDHRFPKSPPTGE